MEICHAIWKLSRLYENFPGYMKIFQAIGKTSKPSGNQSPARASFLEKSREFFSFTSSSRFRTISISLSLLETKDYFFTFHFSKKVKPFFTFHFLDKSESIFFYFSLLELFKPTLAGACWKPSKPSGKFSVPKFWKVFVFSASAVN